MLAAALLAALLAQLAARLFGVRALSTRLVPPVPGQRFATWALRLWVEFATPALIVLALLRRTEAFQTLPPEFAAAAAPLGGTDPRTAGPILIGLALGTLLNVAWAAWRVRRGKRPLQVGRVPLPEAAGELPAGAALAVSAGVSEELYFRLALPLLLTAVLGSAVAAFVAASVLFGLVHRHQGWAGMLATGLVGAALAAVYLRTGALWLAVVFHALVDLNGLVLRPWLGMMMRREA
jgi:membrane protease YdiL (CAAX protease family)